MFQKLYEKAKVDNSEVADCDYYRVEDENHIYPMVSMDEKLAGTSDIEKKREIILSAGRAVCKIYKRSFIDYNNFRFPEGLLYEDNEFLPIVMVSTTLVSKISENLYYYYFNPNSITNIKNSSQHFDRLVTSKGLIDRFKERKIFDIFQEEIMYRFSMLYYVNTIPMVLTRFDPIPIDKLYEIRDYRKTFYPDYRKNKYFSKNTSLILKLISFINDLNPKIPVNLYKFLKCIQFWK